MPTPEQIAQAAEVLGFEPTKLQEDLEFSNPDPALVARGEEIEQEWRQAKAHKEEKTALLAATEAAASGEMSSAQVALALNAAGLHNAHDAWVQSWQAEEESYSAQDDAESLEFLDAAEYAQRFTAQQIAERAEAEASAADLQRQIRATQVEDLQSDLKAFVDSTPGAHRIAGTVEARLVRSIQESGVLPATPEERAAAIETALRTEAVLSTEEATLREQISTEWRAKRKPSLANGWTTGDKALMTQAEINHAGAFYTEARFKQLADERMVDMESLKPGPTAEETSAALAAKFRGAQEKLVAQAQHVSDIAYRGSTSVGRDHGTASSADKKRYEDAYRRAEETAAYGEARTTEDGTPAGTSALDEYGDAFGRPV